MKNLTRCIFASFFLSLSLSVSAEEIGCSTTTWKMIGANHRVCIYA